MIPARPLLLLVCATAACFSDTAPAGLSTTAASAASETSTTDATTGGGSTTSTTGAATTGATGQPATTTTSTATTSDASTTGTTGTTTTSNTTTGADVDYPECAAIDNQFECIKCCRDAVPGSDKYFVDLEQCVCAEDHPCFSDCSESVCFDDWLEDICYACMAPHLKDACFHEVADMCAQAAACAPYLECLADAGCAGKPAVLPNP